MSGNEIEYLVIVVQTADMEILAAWHSEARNSGRPVVVIVEHIERCSVTALAELIILLRLIFSHL